jgi:hypothetical protein
MTHLSDNFMLETLAKVQPLQLEIYKHLLGAHLDAHVHENIFDAEEHSLDFDLYVFDGHGLLKMFEFNSGDTEEEVLAELTRLTAYVHSL